MISQPRATLLLLVVTGTVLVLAEPAQDAFTPARFVAGPLPTLPIQAVGGGEVFLALAVTETGRVDRTTALRVTPPFVDPLVAAVQTWLFQPAQEGNQPDQTAAPNPTPRHRIRSSVLVAGLFRPPTLNTPTLGVRPTDVARPPNDIPIPVTTIAPLYPPRARVDGVVLVEVEVSTTGSVTKTMVVGSTPGLDGAALGAARQWRFRPARLHGRPVAVFAYLVFGFRQPVTPPLGR